MERGEVFESMNRLGFVRESRLVAFGQIGRDVPPVAAAEGSAHRRGVPVDVETGEGRKQLRKRQPAWESVRMSAR